MAQKKTTSCNKHIPTDIIIDKILIRVPAKSLMRFKLVCKLWQSTILHDRRFHESHRRLSPSRPSILTFVGTYYPLKWYKPAPSIENQFPVIFSQSHWENIPTARSHITFVDTDEGVPSIENRFICSSISSSGSTWEKMVWKDYYTTEVVNGLVCFYSNKSEEDDLYLCNLSTSETMKLPSPPAVSTSPPPGEMIHNHVSYEFLGYYLGFDEVNNVYKLSKIDEEFCYTCKRPNSKTLTIQDNYNEDCWTNTAMPMVEHRRTYCFKSALYWLTSGYLMYFDLNKESYSIIPYPRDPVDPDQDFLEPRFIMYNHHGRYFDCLVAGLTQIGGRLALTRAGATEFNIWFLDLYHNNNNKRRFSSPRRLLLSAKWDKFTIHIPIHLREPTTFFTIPWGALPAGKIFFTIGRSMLYKPAVGFHMPVYSYDIESETWETLLLESPPTASASASSIQAAYKNYSQICYFHEDNILPLKDILAPK